MCASESVSDCYVYLKKNQVGLQGTYLYNVWCAWYGHFPLYGPHVFGCLQVGGVHLGELGEPTVGCATISIIRPGRHTNGT